LLVVFMKRKGLLEWKILAAIFAVLIVVSSALVSNTGIKDIFMNSTGNLGDWLKGSPFSSLFPTPEKTVYQVRVELISSNITLSMESPVNITSEGANMQNFRGLISLRFAGNATSAEFMPAGTDFRFDLSLKETRIENVKIANMILDNVGFIINSENTNITATDDRIEIYDFCGTVTIKDSVVLDGNFSRVKDEQWSIG
jgi:hypothetical protein